jgi:hypothetical protein
MTGKMPARRAGALSLGVLITGLVLACSSPTAPRSTNAAAPPTPAPSPAPSQVSYRVSGVVIDENGSSLAGAAVELYYAGPRRSQAGFSLYTAMPVRTNAGADGRYNISFETDQLDFLGNPNVVGIVRSGNDVQLLPAGAADIVTNLRRRRVRAISAGQSIEVSIQPDSPHFLDAPYIGDHFGTSNRIDVTRLSEMFIVEIPRSGMLTIQTTGAGVTLRELCTYGPEDCGYTSFVRSLSSISGSVVEKSVYEISVVIPSGMAPQRLQISTALQ